MGLGDWACLQIETQEVDLSWNSLSQGIPRWSCRQSMVYLMLLSSAFQEQYIGRMCQNLNFPDISTRHWRWCGNDPFCGTKVSCIEAAHLGASNWTGARPFRKLRCLAKRHVWQRHFCSPPALLKGNRLHSSSLEKHFSLGAKFTMNALKDQLKL